MSKAQLDEGRKATPLKGHPYHEKSDDELHYIIKDAGEAAHASRGLSAEGKYLDQVNDASTVLYHRKMGGKQVVKPKNEEVEVDEAVVAKATLEKYRKKNKERFQAKGGLSAAFDKLDKEDKKAKKAEVRKEEVEQVDEVGFANKFSPLKKTAPNTGYMNVGGGKKGFNSSNPDMRINRRAGLDKDIGWDADAPKAQAKQAAQMAKFKAKAAMRKESIVDMVMVQDEMEAAPYISEIEARCDALVSAIKDEMKQTIFALEGHSVKQLKQAASHHRLHKNANEKAAESPTSRKYGTEDQFRMKAHKHDKARKVADGLRHRMDDAGVSHSSRLPKGK